MLKHRVIINTNAYDIPERLKEYDESFFIVYNLRNEKFEVHSWDNIGSTYCFTVPYDELDERTINLVIKNDTKRFGYKELQEEIRLSEEKREKEVDRNYKNYLESVHSEVYPLIKKDLDHEYIGVSRKGLYNESL